MTMCHNSINAFDRTLQATHSWLHDIMERMDWQDKHLAYRALRAVLHALRDRLSVEQAAALGAQLPMLVRGLYYEAWHPGGKPVKERKKEEFLAHVGLALRDHPEVSVEDVTEAVFEVIAKHVSPGEVEHIKITLPDEIRSLWSEESHSLWF